ncbi:hypothetical protein CASFOL_016162 [Castilleja foliolosa]|uniref:Protein kinase domain-containing protein n=1 Tax=Castilleja foliolosa TaxID=1961234 RepID=A0ABD3DJA3_9LAMI
MSYQAIIVLVTITILLFSPKTNSLSDCQKTCGNLNISFPFGTTSNCSLDHSFLISCDPNYNPPKPFLNSGIEILDISLDEGLIRVESSIATDCYDTSGSQLNGTISELTLSHFAVSSVHNKFTAVGCDTYALVEGSSDGWKAGCVSWCDDISRVKNGTCSGVGCCQTSIPNGVRDFLVDIRSFRNHTSVRGFNPCGYAFVAENEAYEFSSSDLVDLGSRKSVPVVLDWSVGNVSCAEARNNVSGFACLANHSECVGSSNVVGYRCKCLDGFQGNPYLVDGCQDMHSKARATTNNNNGSSALFYIVSGFMIPAVGSSWILWRRKQKKVVKLKQNIFIRNGGKLLEDMQSRGPKTLSVFTADDLALATNNYDENNILRSHQGFGTTYKGALPDGTNRKVTILKHDETIDDCDVEAFISRIISLSRVHHKNLSRLLGCCLETPSPLLVYEFITIFTLYDYILDDILARSLLWDVRLRIAADIAKALDYVHTSASAAVPIIHARLSSSVILLHHDHNVKLSDFAISLPDTRRINKDYEICCFDGIGYLDPEYLVSGRLTGKSDVYSFGVVLAELLTGRGAFSYGWGESGEKKDLLAKRFVSSVRGDELVRILDNRLETDDDIKIEMLTKVGKLAEKCLSDLSLNRPTMKEVAIELENIVTGNNCSSSTICVSSSRGTTKRRVMRRIMSL